MQPQRPSNAVRRLLPAVLLTGGGGAFLAGMHPAPELPSEDVALQTPVSQAPPLGDPNVAASGSSADINQTSEVMALSSVIKR